MIRHPDMPTSHSNGGAALKSDRDLKRLSDPGLGILLFFLLVFALVTLYCRQTYLAAAELTVFVILLVYAILARRARSRLLSETMEALAYDVENAKSNTLRNFPLPMAVFKLDDTSVVWGNEMFFSMFGVSSKRLDARMAELLPGFTGKWLLEGREQYPSVLEIDGRQYQVPRPSSICRQVWMSWAKTRPTVCATSCATRWRTGCASGATALTASCAAMTGTASLPCSRKWISSA